MLTVLLISILTAIQPYGSLKFYNMAQIQYREHYRKLWMLSLPLIASNLSVPLFGLIDTALLAHIPSTNHLSAVSIAASLCTFILASFNFLRMGSTAIGANSLGKGSEQNLDFLPLCLMATTLGLLIALLGQPLSFLGLNIMGIQTPLYHLASDYIQIRLWAAPAVLLNYVCLGFLIGRQKTQPVLIILIAGSIVNIAADVLFIKLLSMNSKGAAIATVLADYTSLALSLYYTTFRYRFFHTASMHWQAIRSLISFNRRLWIRSISLMSVFIVFNALSENLGSANMAVNAILLQLLMMQSYLLDGVAQATEARVGFFNGQSNRSALTQTLIASFISSLSFALVISFLLLLLKEPIIQLLTNNLSLQNAIASHYIWAVMLPIIGFSSYWLDGVAVGLTAARAMQNAMLIAVFLIFTPLCMLQHWLLGSNFTLWLIFTVFSLSRAAILWYFLSSKMNLTLSLKG